MFGIADLIAVAVINDGLKNLAANPRHLEFVLGAFSFKLLQDQVGPEHVKQCVEFVTQNAITVAPYYQLDIKRRPSVAVVSSGAENQQFIGDFGNYICPQVVLPPTVYAKFEVKAINGNTISVSANHNLDKKLWKGIFILALGFGARLDGMLVREGEDTLLYLDREVPAGTALVGWTATSSPKATGAVLGASIDDCTIQCKLTTTGDYTVHRLLSIVLRYCLKRGRPLFNDLGLQVATFGYSPPVLSDSEEMEFETVYTINAKFTDHWIEREFDAPDQAAQIDTDLDLPPP